MCDLDIRLRFFSSFLSLQFLQNLFNFKNDQKPWDNCVMCDFSGKISVSWAIVKIRINYSLLFIYFILKFKFFSSDIGKKPTRSDHSRSVLYKVISLRSSHIVFCLLLGLLLHLEIRLSIHSRSLYLRVNRFWQL